MRSAILLTISELESELRTELETKMLIIIRHAETESDKKWWKKPGAVDEWVTKRWIQESRNIWRRLRRLKLDIRTSETERGRVTAKLLCESSQHCVGYCLWCDSAIVEERALRNRTKDEENKYGDSFLGRVIATHPGELYQLLNKICFSTKHSQVVLMSHADTIKALKVLLENMEHKNLIHSERTSVKNGTTLTYLVQWWHIVTANLFFSIENWIPVTRRVNSIIRGVFWERKLLYPRDMSDVDIFDLHGQFLDYIDEKIENHPNKTKEFIRALDSDPLTAHFSQVLRTQWKIS
jgi:broad specificity phosphatase PhoE